MTCLLFKQLSCTSVLLHSSAHFSFPLKTPHHKTFLKELQTAPTIGVGYALMTSQGLPITGLHSQLFAANCCRTISPSCPTEESREEERVHWHGMQQEHFQSTQHSIQVWPEIPGSWNPRYHQMHASMFPIQKVHAFAFHCCKELNWHERPSHRSMQKAQAQIRARRKESWRK